jgi:hypothetical protein
VYLCCQFISVEWIFVLQHTTVETTHQTPSALEVAVDLSMCLSIVGFGFNDETGVFFSDRSIPSLESTMSEYNNELQQLASLVASQVTLEQTAHQNYAKTAQSPVRCVEPA